MKNSHLKTKTLNHVNVPKQPTGRPDTQRHVLPSGLQVKDRQKIEIMLSATQLKELSWLLKSYNTPKPGWLRRRFCINQRRRKLLNDALVESGCDSFMCGTITNTTDWSYDLHAIWHAINERPLCK